MGAFASKFRNSAVQAQFAVKCKPGVRESRLVTSNFELESLIMAQIERWR